MNGGCRPTVASWRGWWVSCGAGVVRCERPPFWMMVAPGIDQPDRDGECELLVVEHRRQVFVGTSLLTWNVAVCARRVGAAFLREGHYLRHLRCI
jgi:hypothetical protein